MTKTELTDMLDEYKMGLLSKATDGTIDDKYYSQTRNALLENVSMKNRFQNLSEAAGLQMSLEDICRMSPATMREEGR